MTVFVIGLGSMGKRRIGILKEYPVTIIGIDSSIDRCQEASNTCSISTELSLDNCKINTGDCAFVCTSPLSHNKIIRDCLSRGLHVFTEINLVADGYLDNMKLANDNQLILFLSSTFLYRSETKYIIERVKQVNTPKNYIYHVGQFLPDWHPWENYNSFFVNEKRTNGCRELFAIELPWIVSCFGVIKEISVLKRKMSNLNILYDDSFIVTVQHEDGTFGMIAVDVVSRKAVRKLEVYGQEIHLTWDGSATSVFDYDIDQKELHQVGFEQSEHKQGYADFISENPYKEEIMEFFECISNHEKKSKWSFEKDLKVLEIIDKIEA